MTINGYPAPVFVMFTILIILLEIGMGFWLNVEMQPQVLHRGGKVQPPNIINGAMIVATMIITFIVWLSILS